MMIMKCVINDDGNDMNMNDVNDVNEGWNKNDMRDDNEMNEGWQWN